MSYNARFYQVEKQVTRSILFGELVEERRSDGVPYDLDSQAWELDADLVELDLVD